MIRFLGCQPRYSVIFGFIKGTYSKICNRPACYFRALKLEIYYTSFVNFRSLNSLCECSERESTIFLDVRIMIHHVLTFSFRSFIIVCFFLCVYSHRNKSV